MTDEYSKEIHKTQFVNSVLNLAILAQSEVGADDPTLVKPKFLRTPNQHEYYLINLGRAVAQLIISWEQLAIPSVMLNQKNSEYLREKGINKHKRIIYEIENYLYRVAAIYDRVLLLVNATYHLGLDPNHVNHSTIISNQHVKHAPVRPLLKNLKKKLKSAIGDPPD